MSRCISYWKWGILQCHVSCQGCNFCGRGIHITGIKHRKHSIWTTWAKCHVQLTAQPNKPTWTCIRICRCLYTYMIVYVNMNTPTCMYGFQFIVPTNSREQTGFSWTSQDRPAPWWYTEPRACPLVHEPSPPDNKRLGWVGLIGATRAIKCQTLMCCEGHGFRDYPWFSHKCHCWTLNFCCFLPFIFPNWHIPVRDFCKEWTHQPLVTSSHPSSHPPPHRDWWNQ